MKIVAWNMNHWQTRARSDEAWRYLTDELTPTVALLTEARPPASLIEDGRVASPKWTDGRLHRCIDRSRI
jgi:hypothetical protein